jgi:signal transduction histidine kinase
MGEAAFDDAAFQLEQGQGLRRRSRGALVIAALIHGANLATGDAALVGWARALPLRLVALGACVAGLLVLRAPRPRWELERVLGPLWLLQLGVLAAMQWSSPRDSVYPWSGAIVFGSLLLTLGSGFSPRWSALLLAVGLALPTGVLLARLGTASDMPVHAIVAVAVVAAARSREHLARAEFTARSALVRLQEERLRAQRAGFVEELHDGAAAGIARAASLLDRANRSGDPLALRSARAELDAALHEARALMNDLDEPALRWTDLAAELRRALMESAERGGLRAVFETDGIDEGPVDEPLAHALRRVVREAGTNVLRHAEARSLHVVLRRHDGRVELCLEDDGRGLSDQAPPGRGLTILEARVRRLGGTFTLSTRDQGGTRLWVTLPEVPSASG